ncbi:DUF2339 domain-containing protein [Rapidithrix thailandica]|uniref:DUF2339 domain-containing protein n=1 Tax=Rapidithrix thailandica TaxID=413964 RepID=A0AAW9SEH3_9BACT
MEEDKNKEDSQKPREELSAEEAKKSIQEFRRLLTNYRFSHKFEDPIYASLKEDEVYKAIFEAGGFTKHEQELITRLYPSLEEMEEMRKNRSEEEREGTINWKNYENKVYVKEFLKDEAVIQEEIAQMKSQKESKKGPLLDKIPTDLPEIKKDLEEYIGENIINKVAVLIISIGVLILFRYGVSTGMVSEGLRVATGILIGGGFFGLAHYLLTQEKSYTNILVSAGTFVLYYTTLLAYEDYGWFNQTQAFVTMVLITCLCVLFAVWYNKGKLSVAALIGGYATPLLVSDGGGNYVAFFSYISALNVSMLAVAYMKRWKIIHVIATVITTCFLGGWMFLEKSTGVEVYLWFLFFTSLAYLTLTTSNLLFHDRNKKTFFKPDHSLYLLLTVLYAFSTWLSLVKLAAPTSWYAAFSIGIGMVNLAYFLVVFHRHIVNQEYINNFYLVIACAFTIPGYLLIPTVYLNTFFAVEAMVIFWLAIQLEESYLKKIAFYICLCTVASLGYTWIKTYFTPESGLEFMFNRGFWASLITCGAVMLIRLMVLDDRKTQRVAGIGRVSVIRFLGGVLLLSGYLTVFLEIVFHTEGLSGGNDLRVLLVGIFTMLYLLLFRKIIFDYELDRYIVFNASLMVLTVLSYLFFGHSSTITLRNLFLVGELPFYAYGIHYINVGLTLYLAIVLITDIRRAESYQQGSYSFVIWLLCIMGIAHATFELEHTILLVKAGIQGAKVESMLEPIRLTGWSVLWSVICLLLMFLGMKYKIKELRMISLTLFTLTIVKFFGFDIWKLDTIAQIIATILIGVVMLIVSLQYKYVKQLVNTGNLNAEADNLTDEYFSDEMLLDDEDNDEDDWEY